MTVRGLGIVAIVFSLGLLLVAAACGVESPPPSAPPVESPVANGDGATESNPAEAAARRALSEKLGVPEKSFTLILSERREWNDTSLGCPQPGRMYAQVITPGHRFIFEHGGDEYNYEYRTNSDGSIMVAC